MRTLTALLSTILLLMVLAELGTAASTCRVESDQNITIAGFLMWRDCDTYYQMLDDGDFIAAEKFLTEKLTREYAEYALIFENGTSVYVNDRSGDKAEVRLPGDTALWKIKADLVSCPR